MGNSAAGIVVVVGGLAFAASGAEVATNRDALAVRSFLEQHCTKCHGPEKQKGEWLLE